ncbi:hypothetical protein EVAR_60001_1 [Eumeta japonica]|uniref:Uncharacterized protein n=1 Tax=Eumeta variegata TaxID=151549 RepID=A0A4C1ZGB6_EUMVA|nr:hypothetical protein EVAR_60001_1 [Eumeta japonica]
MSIIIHAKAFKLTTHRHIATQATARPLPDYRGIKSLEICPRVINSDLRPACVLNDCSTANQIVEIVYCWKGFLKNNLGILNPKRMKASEQINDGADIYTCDWSDRGYIEKNYNYDGDKMLPLASGL